MVALDSSRIQGRNAKCSRHKQNILTVLGKEFYGLEENEYYEHIASLFMYAKIYDLNKSEEYFFYMQKILSSSSNADKPAYLKHYLRSFPSHVPDAVEKNIKGKKNSLSCLSLAQLHGFIMVTWQSTLSGEKSG